jgi:uncharacterized protein YegL
MPSLMGKNVTETHQTLHGFNFSGAKIDSLGASKYTLVTIVQDTSTSVGMYSKKMEETLKKILEACKKSPYSENILLRLATFNSRLKEIHGFRELNTIKASEYDKILKCQGMTALYDSILDSLESMESYGKRLVSFEYDCNGILFIITDGIENDSTIAKSPSEIKDAINRIKTSEESMESLISILIGIGKDKQVMTYLDNLKIEAELNHFLDMGDVTSDNLAKMGEFITSSISSISKNLVTGNSSQLLQF